MILDNFLNLADTVTTTTAAASTDYIDTLAAGDAYQGAWFVVMTESTAFTATGTVTVTFQLQTCASSGFGSSEATAGTTLAQSAAFTYDQLTANKIVYKTRIPPGALRYLRGYYYPNPNTGSNCITACSYSMFIVKDADINSLVAQE